MEAGSTQVSETTTKPTRALEAEINAFCQLCRLTPRETEVVFVLAEGLVRIKEIAERLDLSPNTVNNHVNSIFVKTKTRSKSQLLSILLNRIAVDLYWARLLKQTPRLLCLSSGAPHIPAAAAGLDPARYRVSALTIDESLRLANESYWSPPHFVLCELKSCDEAEGLISKLKNLISTPVIFYAENVDSENKCNVMDIGAIDLIDANESSAHLESLLLGHFIEDEHDRWKYLEAKIASTGAAVSHFGSGSDQIQPITVLPDHCGEGGFFISSSEIERVFKRGLQSGEWVEFPVVIGEDNQSVKVRGYVVWVRSATEFGRAAGAGVRLVYSNGKLSSFMASQPKKRKSYIPAGVTA